MNDLILADRELEGRLHLESWMLCLKVSKEWMRGTRLRQANEQFLTGQRGVSMAQGEPPHRCRTTAAT
ncbi:MAG: hypothetical protein ACLSHL_09605 [Alistipes communis]